MRLQYAVLCGHHKKWRGAEVPVTNEATAQRMRAIFATQLGPAVARLGLRPAQARMRAGLVATQMLGLALCRYALRLPPVAAMSRAGVVAWLGPTIQRYLTAPNQR